MFWQQEYLRESIAMTLNSTYRITLPEHGWLGALLIKIEGNNVTGHGQDAPEWRVLDNITGMEVILNGATICKSLRGDMVQALAFYDNGITAPDLWRHYAENSQFGYFLIDFGRHLYDPLVGLDLSKFASVELKIVNDAAAATEFSALTVSILAFYLREGPAAGPLGYMRSETWREWTTVQAATEYLLMPTEFPIRRIVVQGRPGLDGGHHVKRNFYHMMEDIELNLDTGQTRVFKGGLDVLAKSNIYSYRHELITGGEVYGFDSDAIETGIGSMQKSAHGSGHVTLGTDATVPATFQVTDSANTQNINTYPTDEPIRTLWSGCGYHNTAVLRFDWDPDPLSWLDPKKRASVELNIITENNANAAAGTNRVILDRFVRA